MHYACGSAPAWRNYTSIGKYTVVGSQQVCADEGTVMARWENLEEWQDFVDIKVRLHAWPPIHSNLANDVYIYVSKSSP